MSSLFERQDTTTGLESVERLASADRSKFPISWRLAALSAVLVLNLLVREPLLSLAIFVFALTQLFLLNVSSKEVLARLAVPVGIGVVLVLTQLFWFGKTPLFQASFWGMDILFYREGLWEGLALAVRVIAGFSAVLLFIITTSFVEILAFAKEHRIPPVLVELTALAYRFVFVLKEDAVRIREAQLLRLGYADFSKTVRSVGILGGKLVINSFDRSAAVYEAMKLRGYES